MKRDRGLDSDHALLRRWTLDGRVAAAGAASTCDDARKAPSRAKSRTPLRTVAHERTCQPSEDGNYRKRQREIMEAGELAFELLLVAERRQLRFIGAGLRQHLRGLRKCTREIFRIEAIQHVRSPHQCCKHDAEVARSAARQCAQVLLGHYGNWLQQEANLRQRFRLSSKT